MVVALTCTRLDCRLAKCCCGLLCCVVWSQLQPSLRVCLSRTRSCAPCISRCTHATSRTSLMIHEPTASCRRREEALCPIFDVRSRCSVSGRCCARRAALTTFLFCCRYNAVKGWEAATRAGSGEHFVRENFLSRATLQMLQVQTPHCNCRAF